MPSSRREFLAASAAAATLSPGLFAAGDDTIKVGLIGCGGRGTGAASEALKAAMASVPAPVPTPVELA